MKLVIECLKFRFNISAITSSENDLKALTVVNFPYSEILL